VEDRPTNWLRKPRTRRNEAYRRIALGAKMDGGIVAGS